MATAIIPILKTVGDICQYALPIGVGLYSLYQGHKREALAFGIAAGAQQAVLNTLKQNISAPRPFPNDMRMDSFPSGHTAGAFLAVGYVLALDMANIQKASTPYKVSLIALAAIVGVSRYFSCMHWPIDIVAGSLIGLLFGSQGALVPRLQSILNSSQSNSDRCLVNLMDKV